MQKIFLKNEILFSIIFIIIYVLGSSIFDSLSLIIKQEKLLTLIFHLLISIILLIWIFKNSHKDYYGFCHVKEKLSKFLYFIPLIILSSCNLWLGITFNLPFYKILINILSMILVGFIEEIIFRGLLFKAMEKDNQKSAIIVSSLTFGIGHIINLFNGSGMDLVINLCQIVSAILFGFLFVIIFIKSKSLIPCILSHSTINALSVISKTQTINQTIITSLIISIIIVVYLFIILKNFKNKCSV